VCDLTWTRESDHGRFVPRLFPFTLSCSLTISFLTVWTVASFLSLLYRTDALLLDTAAAAAAHAPPGLELSIGIIVNGSSSVINGTTTSDRQQQRQHAATVTTTAVVAPFIGRSSSLSLSWHDVTIRPRAVVASHHQNMDHHYEVVCGNATAVMTLQQQEQAFDGSPRLDWEITVSGKQDA
jgi:hypothetical protein